MSDQSGALVSVWSTEDMTPEARALYEQEFLPGVRRMMAEVERVPLAVLVWGPGIGGGKLYEKRLQIRTQLRLKGLAALFSEEVAEAIPAGYSIKAQELFQAAKADLIVILQASPGSIAEAHDLGHYLTSLGRKMLVFLDERFSGGYSYQGALSELNALYGNVEPFNNPKDLDECNLLGKIMSRVDVLRMARWRARLEQ